jgi:CheY-like chemotaxis protein
VRCRIPTCVAVTIAFVEDEATMPCVLIVEDDDDVREMMELLLKSHDYETMTARNGLEALAQMRRRRPCLVLLDIHMPLMSGWEFRRRQLDDPSLADVPVVCITALFDPEDVVRQLGLPCLSKPADFPTVMHEVEAHCGVPNSVGLDRRESAARS